VDFFDLCDKEIFLEVEKSEKYKKLFAEGYKYLDDNHLLKDENEEYKALLEFFKIFLLPFPELGFDAEKIKTVAEKWVFDYSRLALYPDVKDMLEKWKNDGYALGIISDTWPSLVNCFKHYGIYDYFDVFVMSCDYGIWKPHEKMYLSALEPLGAKGEESVFVDDSIENLEGAERFSINPVQIARKDNDYTWQFNKSREEKYPKFENLIEIDGYIAQL